jgi:ferredoxin-NADP reductase
MVIRGVSKGTQMTDIGARPSDLTRWQRATLTGVSEQTPRIKSFFLTPAEPFAFIPGQHVDLRLTAPDGYRAIRSYSIASAPENADQIELAIERLEDGEVSPFFHDVAAIGDDIEMRGPLGGHFVWPNSGGGALLLIGGGSGVVPLVSMVRHRAIIADRTPVALLLSSRTWKEIPFRQELLELDSRNDGFKLALTLTREAPRRADDYGRRIDGSIISGVLSALPGRAQSVFVCGSNAFANVAADAVVATGISAASVKVERYGA